jgi:hypothetical protein
VFCAEHLEGRKLKPDKNQELAKLIGRRLREACESDASVALPLAITTGLAKIRQAETRSAESIDICTSSNGNGHALDGVGAGSDAAPPSHEPLDASV